MKNTECQVIVINKQGLAWVFSSRKEARKYLKKGTIGTWKDQKLIVDLRK